MSYRRVGGLIIRARILAFLAGVLLVFFAALAISVSGVGHDLVCPSDPHFDPTSTYIEQDARYLARNPYDKIDNRTSLLVWQKTYFVEALLEGYLLTGETSYLDRFVTQVDQIFANRDDHLGRTDYTGRSRPGWSVAHHYTYSAPVVLGDADGNPSLEIRAVRWTGNQETRLDISHNGDTYSIRAVNGFRLPEPIVEEFRNLKQGTVEAIVNANPAKDRLIRVTRIGDLPPASRSEVGFEPLPMVFHTHHTGFILAPILRFAALVKTGGAPSGFEEKTEEYIHWARESLADYEDAWEDRGDWGFYRMPKGIPFWADGSPEPINAMSAHGRAQLYLYEATGDETARDRAAKIARLIQRYMTHGDDGGVSWPYAHGESFTGWTKADGISVNTPDMEPYSYGENVHYAQPTLRFLAEANRLGVAVTDETLAALRQTFRRIWKRDTPLGLAMNGFLAPDLLANMLSIGKYDRMIYGFVTIADQTMLGQLATIYRCKFASDHDNPVTFYTWGLIGRRLRGGGF